jgi:hypothetical protein
MTTPSDSDKWLGQALERGIKSTFLQNVDLTDKAHKDALYQKFGTSGDVEQQVELLIFLRTYQQQANSKSQQQPLQFSESAIASLNEMAEEYMAKKRTIRLSVATEGAKVAVLDMLRLPEKGASWPNKPAFLQHVDGFEWLMGDEDSEENRQAYMNYLRNVLLIPSHYDLADAQPNRNLLSVELFREMPES